jgi:hypothetical protein
VGRTFRNALTEHQERTVDTTGTESGNFSRESGESR